jgi:hypothetical protein
VGQWGFMSKIVWKEEGKRLRSARDRSRFVTIFAAGILLNEKSSTYSQACKQYVIDPFKKAMGY